MRPRILRLWTAERFGQFECSCWASGTGDQSTTQVAIGALAGIFCNFHRETAGPSTAIPGFLLPGKGHCRSLLLVGMTRGEWLLTYDSASRIAEELPIRLAEFKVSNHSLLVIPTRISYFALLATTTCAALRKESRMQIIKATGLHRGSGGAKPMDLQCPLPGSKIPPSSARISIPKLPCCLANRFDESESFASASFACTFLAGNGLD
jgi:hypothetical protein